MYKAKKAPIFSFRTTNPAVLSVCFLCLIITAASSTTEAGQTQKNRRTPVSTSTAKSTPTARSRAGSVKVITGHPDSVVFINNVRHGITGENGELNLPHVMV